MSRQTATTHEAIVVGVQEQAFDVIVPGLILERRIHVMNLPLETFKYSTTDGVLHLFWKRGVATADAMVEQADADDDNTTAGKGGVERDDDELVDVNSSDDNHGDEKEQQEAYGCSDAATAITTSAPPSTTDHAISEAVNQLSIKSAPSSADHNSQQPQTPVTINTKNTKKQRPRSMSLRAIEGENPWTSQQECTIPNESRQVIRPFDYIRVVITSHPDRSPPLIRVLAANPFV